MERLKISAAAGLEIAIGGYGWRCQVLGVYQVSLKVLQAKYPALRLCEGEAFADRK